MKRLWVRISAVAAVVATLGGGGYYFLASGTAASEGENLEVVENDEPTKPDEIIPVKDEGDGFAPVFDATQAALTDEPGYRAGPTEPAQANWQDQPSQPIIRRVSNDENAAGGYVADASNGYATDTRGLNDGGNGTGNPDPGASGIGYQVGDAPPADLTNGYGGATAAAAAAAGAIVGAGAAAAADAAYDPAGGYGGTASTTDYAPAGYGETGSPAGYGAPSGIAPVTTTDGGYGYDTSGPPGDGAATYPDDTLAAPPAATRQDLGEAVAAPNFANGESIGASSPATPAIDNSPTFDNAPGAAPDASAAQITDNGLPDSQGFDPTTSPQFDAQPSSAATPSGPDYAPPAVNPVYADPPAAQPAPVGQSAALAASSAALVAATPGERTLDGRQTPSISVEKLAPAEIQVGKPAAFKTYIRNTGSVVAKNVVIRDRLPQGTQLIDVTPQPDQAPDGSMVWQFESMEPNEEVVISLEVMPQVEGEIGNQALVTFQAQASVRTICTKPQLLVEHSTDPKVLIGEDVVFNITISNPGSGDATGIVLEEDVPPGLSHVAGKELEYEIGTLKPGDSRRLELVLKASEAGITTNKLRVRGDANLLAEHATQLEVIAPKLQVGMVGPQRRYLDRKVTYQVTFGNVGTAVAKNVEFATYLPKGLQFVSATGKGQYDQGGHAVYWSLDQLSPGQEGTVDLTAIPVATGEQKLQTEATADLGLSQKYEHTTVVDAITEVVFTVKDTHDPIEVGSETTYEIYVANKGSKTGTNVQLTAVLPQELTPISGEGTSRVSIQGQQVTMEPLDRMGPGDEATYKLHVKGRLAGDHIIDVRLSCDQVSTPVTKQESTKVYADGF